MEPNSDPNQRSRENMLAVSLVLFVGGAMLVFLYIISLGIVGNVLSGVTIFVIVGSLHYLVWGRSFSDEVAAEREALRRHDARGEKPRGKPAPDAIHDLARTQAIQPQTTPAAAPQPAAPAEAIHDLSRTHGVQPK